MSSTSQARALRDDLYNSVRQEIASRVPTTAQTVLDVGCASGALGAYLKSRRALRVWGVEPDPSWAEIAAGGLDHVCRRTIDEALEGPELPERFDCIVAADVLEHLVDPWATMASLASRLAPGGTMIVSVPNVLWWRAQWQILRCRRWPRNSAGVFDDTHLRWFAYADAIELAEDAGLVVQDVDFRLWIDSKLWSTVLAALTRTPLRPFVAAQHIVVSMRPVVA